MPSPYGEVCHLTSSHVSSSDTNGVHIGPAHAERPGPTCGSDPHPADGYGSQLHVEHQIFPNSTPLMTQPQSSLRRNIPIPHHPATSPFSPQTPARKRKWLPQPLLEGTPGQIRLLTNVEREQQRHQSQDQDHQTQQPLQVKDFPVLPYTGAAALTMPKIRLTTPWGVSFVICTPRPPRRLFFAPNHRWTLKLTPKPEKSGMNHSVWKPTGD